MWRPRPLWRGEPRAHCVTLPTKVSIGIVTWNSADVIGRCLACVRAQSYLGFDLLVVDNHSADGTRAVLGGMTSEGERLLLDGNVGFAAGHNRAIRQTRGTYYLALNPDVFLSPDFLDRLLEAIEKDSTLGAASGKLLQADSPEHLDSAGIYMVPALRHLDRGQGERDTGQYERHELVFGASGAAALYRRTMIEDVAVEGEVFDEDFFAYREDADLAWRAQLRGWRCAYVPAAVALHRRSVTPARRAGLPATINRMSVRNRFLLRVKNQTAGHFLRYFFPALGRDLQVAGYCLLREHSSLPAFADVARLLPKTWRKRRLIMSRRRLSTRDLNTWFTVRSQPL
jgi:GT2 family glycosyltransferase